MSTCLLAHSFLFFKRRLSPVSTYHITMTESCTSCHSSFSFFRSKYTCKSCSLIYCNDCNPKRSDLDYHRYCTTCYINKYDILMKSLKNNSIYPLKYYNIENISNCMSCNNTFTLFLRKKNCRRCGRIVCSDCSPKKIVIEEIEAAESIRVCDDCYSQVCSDRVHAAFMEERPTNHVFNRQLSEKKNPSTPKSRNDTKRIEIIEPDTLILKKLIDIKTKFQEEAEIKKTNWEQLIKEKNKSLKAAMASIKSRIDELTKLKQTNIVLEQLHEAFRRRDFYNSEKKKIEIEKLLPKRTFRACVDDGFFIGFDDILLHAIKGSFAIRARESMFFVELIDVSCIFSLYDVVIRGKSSISRILSNIWGSNVSLNVMIKHILIPLSFDGNWKVNSDEMVIRFKILPDEKGSAAPESFVEWLLKSLLPRAVNYVVDMLPHPIGTFLGSSENFFGISGLIDITDDNTLEMWTTNLCDPNRIAALARLRVDLDDDTISKMAGYAKLFNGGTLTLFSLYEYYKTYSNTSSFNFILEQWDNILLKDEFLKTLTFIASLASRKVNIKISISELKLNMEMGSAAKCFSELYILKAEVDAKLEKDLEATKKYIMTAKRSMAMFDFYFFSLLRQLSALSLSLAFTAKGGKEAYADIVAEKISVYFILPPFALSYPARTIAHLENYSSPSTEIKTSFNDQGQTVIKVTAFDRTIEQNLRVSADLKITNPSTSISYTCIIENLDFSLFPLGRSAKTYATPIMPSGTVLFSCNLLSLGGPYWPIFHNQLIRFVDLDVVWLGDDPFENRMSVEKFMEGFSNKRIMQKLAKDYNDYLSEVDSQNQVVKDSDDEDLFGLQGNGAYVSPFTNKSKFITTLLSDYLTSDETDLEVKLSLSLSLVVHKNTASQIAESKKANKVVRNSSITVPENAFTTFIFDNITLLFNELEPITGTADAFNFETGDDKNKKEFAGSTNRNNESHFALFTLSTVDKDEFVSIKLCLFLRDVLQDIIENI